MRGRPRQQEAFGDHCCTSKGWCRAGGRQDAVPSRHIISAMLAAWSPTRSTFLAMNRRWWTGRCCWDSIMKVSRPGNRVVEVVDGPVAFDHAYRCFGVTFDERIQHVMDHLCRNARHFRHQRYRLDIDIVE